MSTPIKPLADRVVAVHDTAETKTASGLYLPESSKEKSSTATVVAVGPDVKTVKKDDKIIYKDYAGTEVRVGDNDYFIVKEEDILATV